MEILLEPNETVSGEPNGTDGTEQNVELVKGPKYFAVYTAAGKFMGHGVETFNQMFFFILIKSTCAVMERHEEAVVINITIIVIVAHSVSQCPVLVDQLSIATCFSSSHVAEYRQTSKARMQLLREKKKSIIRFANYSQPLSTFSGWFTMKLTLIRTQGFRDKQ